MLLPVFQLVLCAIACFGLFLLWRWLARSTSGAVLWLITAGVLIRAFGGQLAFWISDLNLPVMRHLQVGRGLWIFAIDAIGYVDIATALARKGPMAILFASRALGSVFYVQILATAILFFGAVASVGILINVAAYLCTCAIALRLAGWPKRGSRNVVTAIALLSLTPSMLMWAVQPLKDTTFMLLIAALFFSAFEWHRVWTADAASRRQTIAATIVSAFIVVFAYCISAVRWYFGLIFFVVMLPFVATVIIRSKRHLAATLNSAGLIVLVAVAFFVGAGPYVPDVLRHAIVRGSARGEAQLPKDMIATINRARDSFDRTPAATKIGAGTAIREIDKSLGASQTIVAADRPPDEVYRDTTPGSVVVSATAPPVYVPDPAARPTTVVSVPTSPLARVVAGLAALTLPRFVAQRVGLINLTGGRGLWTVVEADTLVFDVALIFALIACVRALRSGGILSAPSVWMIALVTGTLAMLLAYTVSNFGTLFRHRDMILIGLVLLPLVPVGRESRRRVAVPASAAEEPEVLPAA